MPTDPVARLLDGIDRVAPARRATASARRWGAEVQPRRRLASARDALRGELTPSLWELEPDQAVKVAYNVVLGRDPDPVGIADWTPVAARGPEGVDKVVEALWGSDEAHRRRRFTELGPSLHASRCQFVHTFPRGRRIIDLGGTHQASADGALVAMGYPYDFDELVIVDLPADDRHPIYRDDDHYVDEAKPERADTARGPVTYRYHSMADLSPYPDGSFDLVYSGQTIEHVTEADADRVLAESYRVLRPGGWIAIDTPNGRATRLQQEEFIDPDHEVEYELAPLLAKVRAAGFEVSEVKGLNHLGACIETGVFTLEEVARNQGVFADAEACYLLALVARKPEDAATPTGP